MPSPSARLPSMAPIRRARAGCSASCRIFSRPVERLSGHTGCCEKPHGEPVGVHMANHECTIVPPHPSTSSATVLKLPRFAVSHDGIEDGDELSHGGDEGDLGPFTGLTQTAIEGLQGWIEPHANQGCHVEGTAHRLTATADMALAAILPAVVVDWRNTDQGCDLLVVDGAEFGQFGEEHGSGQRPNTLDAGEQLVALPQLGAARHRQAESGIGLGELALEDENVLLDPAAGQAAG